PLFAQAVVLSVQLFRQHQSFHLSKEGVFARSHAAPSAHPRDKPLRERWALIKDDLKDLEIFGENMYAIHSIAYRKLESFFYVFAIREGEDWLSWEEVKFYAGMLDFPTVPEIEIRHPLADIYQVNGDEDRILAQWLEMNLGQSWEAYVAGPGQLEGYDPASDAACCEGFVIRNQGSYRQEPGRLPVAENEFADLFKLVRQAHIKTDVHWTKNWKPTSLIDYQKYKWYGYEYLSK
ncbi:MAG: RNA ligase family protein, partial [Bacteroidota bacterium]